MSQMTHYLKTWPAPFQEVLEGRKTAEVRRNDRPFFVGDTLCLQEWNPETKAYTGRELARRVSCITGSAGPVVLADGDVRLVVLSLELTDSEVGNCCLSEKDLLRSQLGQLEVEQKRLGTLLHDLAHALGVPCNFGAVEEAAMYSKAVELSAKAGKDHRLVSVLELIRSAHTTILMGSAPKAKADLGEAARLLAALIDGRE